MYTLFRSIALILSILFCVFRPLALLAAPAPAAVTAPSAIYGGQETEAGDWPWMVALVRASTGSVYSGQYCGGTLIHAQWVLTAAHCTYQDGEIVEPSDIDVVLGAHQLTANDGERLAITRIVRHPDFSLRTGDFDVALLQLERNTDRPILRLATDGDQLLETAGTVGMVMGWGLQAENQYTDILRQLSVPLIDMDGCRQAYATYTITDSMLCAGYDEDALGTCSGDSGGPLVVWSDAYQEWVEVGVVSWADGCAQAGRYTVYARISHVDTWIDVQIATFTRGEEDANAADELTENGLDVQEEGVQAVPPPDAQENKLFLPLIEH